MKLSLAVALCKGLDNVIGGDVLPEGEYAIDETVTVHVKGIITKAADTDKKPSMPTRDAVAILLADDEDFAKMYVKALRKAIDNPQRNDIRIGTPKLQILEDKLINRLEIERVPVRGATKGQVEITIVPKPEVPWITEIPESVSAVPR